MTHAIGDGPARELAAIAAASRFEKLEVGATLAETRAAATGNPDHWAAAAQLRRAADRALAVAADLEAEVLR